MLDYKSKRSQLAKKSDTQQKNPIPWWKKTIVYQIYVRSFMDTTGNGIGDLNGIIQKLDYLHELGVQTIWTTPFYPSPHKDFGYGISDFRNVDPLFGDLDTLKKLISEVHKRNMKILLDVTLNHTSDEHPWFIESKKSKNNPKRNWYIWRDGKKPAGKKPPNNWRAITFGSAWRYDPHTDQWYLARYFPFHPELNFRNPDVQLEMLDTLKFWFQFGDSIGVDGFRLDVIDNLFVDKEFRDSPFTWKIFSSDMESLLFRSNKRMTHLPETIQFMRTLRKLGDSYKKKIGEPQIHDSLSDSPSDSPSDATSDSPSDATSDSPLDATLDSPSDATSDSPLDATLDSPSDATSDSPSDATLDSPSDTTSDSPSDATSDALSDSHSNTNPNNLSDNLSEEKIFIGEVSASLNVLQKYCGRPILSSDKHNIGTSFVNDGLNLVFVFNFLNLKLKPKAIKNMLLALEKFFPEPLYPAIVFSNHDRMRRISKIGNNILKAKLNCALQFTIRGTPIVYYGEEIGMENANIPIKDALDPIVAKFKKYPQWLFSLIKKTLKETLNRDECRTPMQWDDSKFAGFSDPNICKNTWLPINPSYKTRNVRRQLNEPDSLLNCYKRFIHTRNNTPALNSGILPAQHVKIMKSVIYYKRTYYSQLSKKSENNTLIQTAHVFLNCKNKKITIKNPATNAEFLVSTTIRTEKNQFPSETISLKPFEGLVLIDEQEIK
ncbi:MAG: alpha-amylase family glycosyl hydrolase [Promethearchaeota archaeon]